MTLHACTDTTALGAPGKTSAFQYADAYSAQGRLAPPPAVDRYPIVIGQNLNLTYIASAKRNALAGYRQQLVDILGELFEEDLHAYAVIQQRILTIAGARYTIACAELEPEDPELAEAQEIAKELRSQWNRALFKKQSIAALAWADIYGVSAAEVDWERKATGWEFKGLRFIHNRRLSYPDLSAWDLYIWDQGTVGRAQNQTTGMYPGLRCADYPHKFVIHTPQLRSEYPTRDGIGRVFAVLMALKRMVLRGVAVDLERNVRPQVVATFASGDDGKPRAADDNDIARADEAARQFGSGILTSVTVPDSIKFDLMKAVASMKPEDFLAYADASMSKAAVGQTFTVEPGKYGAKGTSEQGKEQLLDVCRYSVDALCDSLNAWFVRSWMQLNHPDKMHLCPSIQGQVGSIPDVDTVLKRLKDAVSVGMPIDADAENEKLGFALTPKPEGTTRMLWLASPASLADISMSPEERAEARAMGLAGQKAALEQSNEDKPAEDSPDKPSPADDPSQDEDTDEDEDIDAKA